MGEATDLIGACPYDVARPDLLCDGVIGLISSRKKPYRYAYEQTILEAACVRTRDRPEEVRRKVQELWIRNEDRLTCNTAQFPIINGSIIKAGLNSEFDPFVTDLLQWGVPLNRVDEDGKTALDFLADQRVRYQGTSAERKFRRYYERFREAGAKHAREL